MNYTAFLQNIGKIEAGPYEVSILIFFCLLFFFISAVCSGGEQAFSYLTQKDINMLKAKNNNNSRRISVILERPRVLMIALMLSRIISNLLLIFILNALLDFLVDAALFPALSVVVEIIVIFFLLVLFCETLPRAYARQRKLRMAFFATPLVSSLISIFEPLILAVIDMSDWLSIRVFRKKNQLLSIEDIDRAFTVSADGNVNGEQEEKGILRGLIDFESILVRQVMRTRMDICGISDKATFSEVIDLIYRSRHSRYPVYHKNFDHIVGIIHAKDLIAYLDQPDFDWQTVMRKPIFVPGKKTAKGLLTEFQTSQARFAIVVDEFGGTSGIVTMEDIMEEIVGDIHDEFDTIGKPYIRLGEKEFIFEGKTMLNDVERILDLPSHFFDAARGDNDSLGGLILELSGGFPQMEEPIALEDLELIPVESEKMRISKVKIILS